MGYRRDESVKGGAETGEDAVVGPVLFNIEWCEVVGVRKPVRG